MRLQRALALAGVASRRAAEVMITEGRVTVNGDVAELGRTVESADVIAVDGAQIRTERTVTYLLFKPIGTVSTVTDPQGRPTVLDGFPDDVRLYPVGRLDLNTSGALLITNDGELAHRLMHPSYRVPKVYEALVEGRVSAAGIRSLRDGVELDDGPTHPAKVDRMDRMHPGGTWLTLEIHEGRNRQVRRMCEAVGHRVLRLHRSRYGPLSLGRMARGQWRELTPQELTKLAKTVGLTR
ncbi:MAG TPA: pseudouridine synthase [Miltoncostaeales bacterium]|nr:pseudouridine synthase [Miltoncostaeales bacterium]